MKILVVCTGNICRSPMGEALIRHEARQRNRADIEVASAGTWAGRGNPATEHAVAAIRARGIDLGGHRSRPVDPGELHEADLILAMTSVHRRELLEIDPALDPKIVLVKELAEIPHEPSGRRLSATEALEAMVRGARPEWRRALDLDDPMGMPPAVYERCLQEIVTGVEVLMDRLCPRETRGPSRR